MKTSDFYYSLPPERIAQTPVSPRDHARLLVYDRADKVIEHRFFYDLPAYLRPGDCLVINDTRVLPARLLGTRETGAHMEVLLLKRESTRVWEVLCRPAKRARPGDLLLFGSGLLKARVLACLPEGLRKVEFLYDGVFEELLDALGQMPLPPYITQRLTDSEQYQTVYSREPGSAAAPTAGLHFTPELLQRIKEMGVQIIPLLLHVGLGTFRPVKAEDISAHHMHSEYYELSPAAAAAINGAKSKGGRIIAVGTTSARVLETAANEQGEVIPSSGWTNIFLYPGCRFRATDALITNFHLPESTLLMLVSAFAGTEEIRRLYQEALQKEYRFFSFGDAMFLK